MEQINYEFILNYLLKEGVIDGKCIDITLELDKQYFNITLCGNKLKEDKFHICSINKLNYNSEFDFYEIAEEISQTLSIIERIKEKIINNAIIHNYKITKSFVENYEKYEETCEDYFE